MSNQAPILVQPKIPNILITKSSIESEVDDPPKGTIVIKLRHLKGDLVFTSGSFSFPIDIKIYAHSFNLLEIQNALLSKSIRGIVAPNMAMFLTFLAGSKGIQWARDGVLLEDIGSINLHNGDELVFGLVLNDETGSISVSGGLGLH